MEKIHSLSQTLLLFVDTHKLIYAQWNVKGLMSSSIITKRTYLRKKTNFALEFAVFMGVRLTNFLFYFLRTKSFENDLKSHFSRLHLIDGKFLNVVTTHLNETCAFL